MRLGRGAYIACALLVLSIAALNLFFRLGQEFVTEWDESLYAISAQEMVASGDWVRVTFLGKVDYYNTKPPLNVWLIALAFETWGRSILTLRLASAAAAWLTVAVVLMWTRRAFGDVVSLLAGLVLATTFGFLHVHSGRSANTDALFTLILVLVVVTLWAERRHPWSAAWLGPLLSAAFMLRGPGFLMPLLLVCVVAAWRRPAMRMLPACAALLLFLAPVAAWGAARYRIDQWEFLGRMYSFDFVARATRVLDGHPGGPFYYLNILAKHQWDWLAAGVLAAILVPVSLRQARAWLTTWPRDNDRRTILVAWALVALVIPTLMRTKLPWYLNTFYPLFAVVVSSWIVRGISRGWRNPAAKARAVALSAATVLAFATAEARIWLYSSHYRDLSRSAQGLLLSECDRLSGHAVFRDRFDRSGTFVAGLVGIQLRTALTFDDFMRDSEVGDFLVTSGNQNEIEHRSLVSVVSNHGNRLYERMEP